MVKSLATLKLERGSVIDWSNHSYKWWNILWHHWWYLFLYCYLSLNPVIYVISDLHFLLAVWYSCAIAIVICIAYQKLIHNNTYHICRRFDHAVKINIIRSISQLLYIVTSGEYYSVEKILLCKRIYGMLIWKTKHGWVQCIHTSSLAK